MSVLTDVLAREIRRCEEVAAARIALQKSRLTHHLMPPVGWLNDPNGLCYFKGKYHVFFQYAPFDAEGGLKFWGHYSSINMVDWEYEGVPLFPDTVNDCHGIYSGSALIDNDVMHLFYTGNVKFVGDYDFINAGRRASTLHVQSTDGLHFSDKEVTIHHDDYPDGYTCHIRDPKVWKDADGYRMVLGGRKKDNRGAVIFYASDNLKDWRFDRELTTDEPFGYMWECPDMFEIDGQKILSTSPQGLECEEYRFQNIYQSGYFFMKNGQVHKEDFCEWDMGFDFYAPQTFEDEKGRRILIGWMGLPDVEDEYTNPTSKREGWQHCLTIPREVTLNDGVLYQYPVEEMNELRCEYVEVSKTSNTLSITGAFDLDISVCGNDGSVCIGEELLLEYIGEKVFLRIGNKAGFGRKLRKCIVPSRTVRDIRIMADTTAVEIYLNRGEVVLSTRYYPESELRELKINADKIDGKVYKLKPMNVELA